MPVHPTLRSARSAAWCAAAALALGGAARVAGAQARPPAGAPARVPGGDSTRSDTAAAARRPVGVPTGARGDSAVGPRRTRAAAVPRPGLRPPISPRRALVSSLLVPGLGQGRLQRPTAAAFFVAIELTAITMARKSGASMRAARALRTDTLPQSFPVDTLGVPQRPTDVRTPDAIDELVRARRLHREDWFAVLAFNHLIAGAEAYVSANLWDLPAQISARPTERGTAALVVSVAW